MSKKVLIAIVTVLAISLTAVSSVYAYEVYLKDTVNIYTVQDTEDKKTTVSTFDDRGNKCYIVRNYYSNQSNISCVKQEKE